MMHCGYSTAWIALVWRIAFTHRGSAQVLLLTRPLLWLHLQAVLLSQRQPPVLLQPAVWVEAHAALQTPPAERLFGRRVFRSNSSQWDGGGLWGPGGPGWVSAERVQRIERRGGGGGGQTGGAGLQASRLSVDLRVLPPAPVWGVAAGELLLLVTC